MMPSDESREVGGLWCHEVLELLPDVLEGELALGVEGAVQAHVQACDNCARFGAAYGAVVEALRRRAHSSTEERGAARLARLEAALDAPG